MLTSCARRAGTTCSPNVVDERPAAPGRRGGSTRRRSRASTSSARWSRCQAGSDETSTCSATSSGRTKRGGLSKCSTSSRSQHSGGSKTLVRHWSWATAIASSSVGAHDTCTWRYAGLPSPPLLAERAEHAPQGVERLADGDQARRPMPPTHAAVSARRRRRRAAAEGRPAGSTAGRDRRVTRPWWVTSSPANSARITSTHSPSRRRAHRLVRPTASGDVLVGRLAGARARPTAGRGTSRRAWLRPGR